MKARFRHHFHQTYTNRTTHLHAAKGRFGFLGVSKTNFGVTVASAILDAGIYPRCAFLFAETEAQLLLHRGYWRIPNWINAITNTEQLTDAHTEIQPAKLYQSHGIPYLYLANPKNTEILAAINNSDVDYLIALEAPVLPREFLSGIHVPIINLHSAPLPAYRGASSTYNAIYNDEKLYVSAHLIDAGIDTGPILMRRHLPVQKGDTLETIAHTSRAEAGALAVQVITALNTGGIDAEIQKSWQGFNYLQKHNSRLADACEERLNLKQYTYYE